MNLKLSYFLVWCLMLAMTGLLGCQENAEPQEKQSLTVPAASTSDADFTFIDPEKTCRGVDSWLECQRKIETTQIQKFAPRVSREGGLLQIKLANNESLKFENNTEDSENAAYYFFRTYYPSGHFLLYLQYYEGGSYILINERNGHKEFLFDIPVFSPDRQFAVCTSLDMEVGYQANGLQVFEVGEGKLFKVFEKEFTKWGPGDLKWQGNTAFSVMEHHLVEFDEKPTGNRIRFSKENGEWKQR